MVVSCYPSNPPAPRAFNNNSTQCEVINVRAYRRRCRLLLLRTLTHKIRISTEPGQRLFASDHHTCPLEYGLKKPRTCGLGGAPGRPIWETVAFETLRRRSTGPCHN